MPIRMVCALGLLLVLGCGGDGGGGGPSGPPVSVDPDGGTGRRVCVDEDGDGFGRNCGNGNDCDDDDPSVTDECRRCVSPNADCPCEPGTMPMTGCKPPDMDAVVNGVSGTWVCSEGTRYCREGLWSECEILWQYATFVPAN